MIIDVISDDKIKITITDKELEGYSVTYDQIGGDNPKTRSMITKLLLAAKSKVGFEGKDKKLFIETFPDIYGGCILYFTIMATANIKSSSKKSPGPIIFSFNNLDMIYKICERLKVSYIKNLKTSSLYYCDDMYHLILYSFCENSALTSLAKEYLTNYSTSHLAVVHFSEHGKELIRNFAVETLIS